MRERNPYTAARALRAYLAGDDTPEAWAGGMLLCAALLAWIPDRKGGR